MRSLALDLGLSVTTVSYALRNDPRVKQATRELIHRRAREMGYTPDTALAILNAYRRNRACPQYAGNLAFLANQPDADKENLNHYTTRYYLGAQSTAARQGYQVDWYWTKEPGLSGRRLSQILAARGVRGIIVSPLPEGETTLDLDWSLFSSIRIGYSMKRPALHRVSPDQFQCMALCLRGLYDLGYRRIGLIDTEPVRTELHYLGAYLAVRRQLGLPKVQIFEKSPSADHELLSWLDAEEIDAVVGSSYWDRARLQRIGRCAVGFALPFSSNDPSVACADDAWEFVGAAAASFLVDLIHRNDCGLPDRPYTYIIDPVWRQGSLTGKPSG